jgi:hypothetical protein
MNTLSVSRQFDGKQAESLYLFCGIAVLSRAGANIRDNKVTEKRLFRHITALYSCREASMDICLHNF